MTIYARDPRLYDLIYGGDDARALAFTRWILQHLSISKDDPVLDMGAGTGGMLIPLTKDGYNIEGMEPYESMRAYATTKADLLKVDIKIGDGSFESLAVNNSFKLIMAINGPLHYVENEQLPHVMENLSKALQPEGYLLLDTINFFSIIKNYNHPEPMEFEIDETSATAMIQHWVDLDREKWINRVILYYEDQEIQKVEDIQEMSMFTRKHLETVARRYHLEFVEFFSSYEDRPDDRTYGGRLITVFQKR